MKDIKETTKVLAFSFSPLVVLVLHKNWLYSYDKVAHFFGWVFSSGQDLGTLIGASAALWAAYKWRSQKVLDTRLASLQKMMVLHDEQTRHIVGVIGNLVDMKKTARDSADFQRLRVEMRDNYGKAIRAKQDCASEIDLLAALETRRLDQLIDAFKIITEVFDEIDAQTQALIPESTPDISHPFSTHLPPRKVRKTLVELLKTHEIYYNKFNDAWSHCIKSALIR